MENLQIISPEEVKNESTSFNILIFKQIERINDGWAKVLSTNNLERKSSMAELFFSIRSLETIMWARLNRDSTYMDKRKELNIKDPEKFKLLSSNDIAGLLQFSDTLDTWYKLITNRLDRFNFFPPIDLYNFTNLNDLKKAEESREDYND